VRGERYEAAYLLALLRGLRQGKALGLTWDAVDLGAGRLPIQHTRGRVRWTGLAEGEPKSARGRRSLVLLQPVVEALRRLRARQAPERLREAFHAAVARLGLPRLRFHDLRHTCATLLLTQGVHPKVVQELLGHSTIAMTLDTYSHVLPSLGEAPARGRSETPVPVRQTALWARKVRLPPF
jgi:integrase